MTFLVTFNSFHNLFRFSMQRVLGLRKFVPVAVEYESLWASITQQIWNNYIRKYETEKLMFLRGFLYHEGKADQSKSIDYFSFYLQN